MQLGPISTSTLDVVIETSLVSPVETKQVRKVDLNWTCFSVHTRTERYDIVSFQFLVHFSVPPNFWTCFGTDCLIFFRTRVNAAPLCTTFWNGPKWNGTISYPCEQGLNCQKIDYASDYLERLYLNLKRKLVLSKTLKCLRTFVLMPFND